MKIVIIYSYSSQNLYEFLSSVEHNFTVTKQSHTGLEQLEGEKAMTTFWGGTIRN